MSKNILTINMESIEFDGIRNYKDSYNFIKSFFKDKKGKKYVFIDEIQEISGWERLAASLLADKIADITITGSNAHLLSAELATLLSGRSVEFEMYPLTFREFLLFRNVNKKNDRIETEFFSYLKYGGLPGIHFLDQQEEVVYQYLNSIFRSVIMKDVVKRHNIRDGAMLENIALFTFDNCGNPVKYPVNT